MEFGAVLDHLRWPMPDQVELSFADICLPHVLALLGILLLLFWYTRQVTPSQDSDNDKLYHAEGFGLYKYCGLRPDPFVAEPPPKYSLIDLDLPLPHMEPIEIAALDLLEQSVADVRQGGYHRTDRATLLRFLRARKGDVQLAGQLLRDAANWRQAHDVNRALTHWNLTAWEQCLAPWWPSGGLMGFGLNGEPVALERLGHCDWPKLSKTLPLEVLLKMDFVHCMRSLAALEEDAMRRQVPLGRALLVMDIAGFSYQHIQIEAARKMAKLVESRALLMTETAYRILIVRAPAPFVTAWNMFNFLLDPGIVEKVHMATTGGSLGLLRQYLDDDNIPAYLGGSKCTNGDPECRHILAPGGFPPKAALDRFNNLIEEEKTGAALLVQPSVVSPAEGISPATNTEAGKVIIVNAEPCRPRGVVHNHNSLESCPFESDVCTGCFLSLHRPTDAPELLKQGGSYPYQDHMHNRRRLWEHRIQFTMKRRVDGPTFFGVEQDKFQKVPWRQRAAAAPVVAALRKAAGGLYQSYGDDPQKTQGEVERPTVAFPLAMMDQFIFTPEGETPPDLTDPKFPELGALKTKDRAGLRATLKALDLAPGPTFTFGFWCIAQYLDTLQWHAPRTMLPPLSLLKLGIYPPGFITMYSVKQDDQHNPEHRHLDSKKVYLWRVAFWSSHMPPNATRARELMSGSKTSHNKDVVLKKKRACCGCI